MKLKTLKDIEQATPYRINVHPYYTVIRQEAIKWVKTFRSNPMILPDKLIKNFAAYPTSKLKIEGAIDILKYIFNITEEELK